MEYSYICEYNIKIMSKIHSLFLSTLLLLGVSCNSSNKEARTAQDAAVAVDSSAVASPQSGTDMPAPDDSPIIAEIKKEIEAGNSKCPLYIGAGNGLSMDSMVYRDNTVIYNYSVDRINDAVAGNESIKKSLLYMLKGEAEVNPATTHFFNNVINAGAKLIYRYTTPSGKSMSVEISNEELKSTFDK